MLNKGKTYACHSAIYQSGAKNKGFETQTAVFATRLGCKEGNASAFVLSTRQMNLPLEEEVATDRSYST